MPAFDPLLSFEFAGSGRSNRSGKETLKGQVVKLSGTMPAAKDPSASRNVALRCIR
jgi:hypothetical protein